MAISCLEIHTSLPWAEEFLQHLSRTLIGAASGVCPRSASSVGQVILLNWPLILAHINCVYIQKHLLLNQKSASKRVQLEFCYFQCSHLTLFQITPLCFHSTHADVPTWSEEDFWCYVVWCPHQWVRQTTLMTKLAAFQRLQDLTITVTFIGPALYRLHGVLPPMVAWQQHRQPVNIQQLQWHHHKPIRIQHLQKCQPIRKCSQKHSTTTNKKKPNQNIL